MEGILLLSLNAKFIHTSLALYSLRSYALKKGYETDLLECTINQQEDVILRLISKKAPRILAISCYIWNADFLYRILEDIGMILPDTEIWLGGPEAYFQDEELLKKYSSVKGIMRGEGEETFAELCRIWSENPGKDAYNDVKGISWRDSEGIIRREADRDIMDMNCLVFPYPDLDSVKHRILYYESGRGCPYSCSYCLSSVEKTVRLKDVAKVQEELQIFLDHKVKQVKFVDRTFNLNRSHTKAIWEYIKTHDNGVTNFHFEVSADLLNDEEIEILAGMRAGLVQLEIGVQSTNPQTLKEIHRYADSKKIFDRVRRVKKGQNVHQHLDLIAGLPFEDYESFHRSFLDVYEVKPDQLQLGFLKVLKGSYMSSHVDDYGIMYRSRNPYEVLETRWLSFQSILKLKLVEEMVEVYYNSGQFHNTLEAIEMIVPDMFLFYQSLGSFYEEEGYLDRSQNRIQRYDILRAWLIREGIWSEKIDFLMLLDLYARENVKSRPEWALDLQKHKDVVRAFLKEEEKNRRWIPETFPSEFSKLRSMTHVEIMGEEEIEKAVLFVYDQRDAVSGNVPCFDVTEGLLEVKSTI